MKYLVSLAPMVDRTDNNFRHFVRLLSPNIVLYTEMVTDKAIINNSEKVLEISSKQNPIVLQIATNSIEDAVKAVQISNLYEYDEINLNLGCPSDRISDNRMGAYLMSELSLVTEIVKAISKVTNKPITVKHRIGIDGKGILPNDTRYFGYDFLVNFISTLSNVGVKKYIIHAREAILKGLNPKENRTIPPLDYDLVYRIKERFPELCIEINGGIKTIEDIQKHLNKVDAVMIGREIYDNPMILLEIEKNIFNNNITLTRKEIVNKIISHIKNWDSKNMHRYLMHTMGLFKGTNNSKKWKQLCSNTKVTLNDLKTFLEELE